jgi:hypothetical protein
MTINAWCDMEPLLLRSYPKDPCFLPLGILAELKLKRSECSTTYRYCKNTETLIEISIFVEKK